MKDWELPSVPWMILVCLFLIRSLVCVTCSSSTESDILIDTLNPELDALVFFSGQIGNGCIIFASHQRRK